MSTRSRLSTVFARSRIGRAFAASLLVLAAAPGANAATIVVTSLADNLVIDGQVTLREAVQAANTDTSVDNSTGGSGFDVIQFDPPCSRRRKPSPWRWAS